jgi:hypothetical protein
MDSISYKSIKLFFLRIQKNYYKSLSNQTYTCQNLVRTFLLSPSMKVTIFLPNCKWKGEEKSNIIIIYTNL